MSKTYSAGIVTAYGAAKRAGYQGTYEDFCRQQAGYAGNAAAVEQAKTDAVNAKNDAVTAKNSAVSAKDDAVSAKNTAVSAKDDAVSAKDTATTKAQEASQSATNAGLSAQSAGQSATSADQSARSAEQSAQDISASVRQIATNTADIGLLKADLGDKTDMLFSTKGFADAILTLGGYFDKNGIYHMSGTNWRSYCFDVKNIYEIPIIEAFTDTSTIVNVYFFSVVPQKQQDLNSTTFISFLPLEKGGGVINTYRNVTIPTNAKSMVIVNRIVAYPDAYAQIISKYYDDAIDNITKQCDDSIAELGAKVDVVEISIKTTPNVVNTFFDVWNANDFCIVDDEFWFYKADQGTAQNPYDELRRYKLINGTFVNQATIYCDFGHWNTVDYCKETDCLIFGNGANSFETEGNWFAVVPNAKSLSGTVSLANVGVKYNVNIGYKVQAVWGDDNLGQYNIAIVFSNNATTIKQYLLHKDANGQFDGQMTEIGSGSLTTQIGVGGADYWDGKLIVGGARFNIAEVDVLGGYAYNEQERHYYTNDGAPYSGSMQGVVIDSKYKWLFFNYTDGNETHNALIQYTR